MANKKKSKKPKEPKTLKVPKAVKKLVQRASRELSRSFLLNPLILCTEPADRQRSSKH